ncbi:MAG TPA: adenylate kinase [Actinobacteria bacterium]|nr:adenylate kinase [Actinomycetota bacterium]HCK79187.1 adenylate kinase [Actinomycetota bacterium]
MRLVLVGPPGAGKGTQAQVVAAHLGVPHISTGDIFRANVAGGTDLGQQAQQFMDAGELVPDSVTNAMVADRLTHADAAGGFLLDGYPRNPGQAEVLQELLARTDLELDAVVELVADHETVVQRLLERAAKEGRADDTEEVIRRRLDVYDEQTAPLVDFYRQRGLLRTVDGVGAVDEVSARIIAALPSANA